MRVFLLTILITTVLIRGLAQDQKTMTLEECINYALENNKQLSIAGLERDIAETQISEALSKGLPQIDGTVGFQKNIDIQTSFIQDFISPAIYGVLIQEGVLPSNTEVPTPQTFPAAFGTNFQGQAGIGVRQLLFEGSFFVGLKASRTVKELSEKKLKQTEVEIVQGVSNAFYLSLIAKENLEFIASNFGTIDSLLRDTEIMLDAGFVESIDLARIKIQHNNLRTSLQNNTELLITSVNLLKFQMGMPLSEQISPNGSLEDIQFDEVQAVEAVPENRPEFSVLETNLKLAELNAQNFRSQYIPNIYANYNLGWVAGTNTFNDLTQFNDETWFKYSNIGVTLSVPIFDGLFKRSMVQRAKVQQLQIRSSMDQMANNINREAVEARIKLQNARRSLEAQEENVGLAQEVYNTTKVKYQEGVGPNSEVIAANNSLKEAQTNYLNAVYDTVTAQIELKKALGTLHQ